MEKQEVNPIEEAYFKGHYDGYKEGLEDSKLTWMDVQLIIDAEGSIYEENHHDPKMVFKTYPTAEKFYTGILNRYKEDKK